MSREWLNVYRPSFYRHLRSLVINGFYARDLDADDFAFIDGIRERGNVACGSLADLAPALPCYDDVGRRSVLVEELEYWHRPFAFDRDVERRVGSPSAAAQERARFREERLARLRANREAIIAAQAVTDAELERERSEWAERQRAMALERERRLGQAATADRELEQAKPERRKRGRHYVPDWKRDLEAQAEAVADAAEAAAKLAARQKAWHKAKLEAQRLLARTEHLVAKQDEQVEEHRFSTEAINNLKRAIFANIRGSHPTVWTVEMLMSATQCSDEVLMKTCLEEIVSEGGLQTVSILKGVQR